MMNFYEHLKQRIPTLADLSASSRGSLYRIVIAATDKRIAETGMPALQAAAARMSLDEAIKRIEAEFVEAREKSGRHAPAWALPPEPAPAPAVAFHAARPAALPVDGPSSRMAAAAASAPATSGTPPEWDAPVSRRSVDDTDNGGKVNLSAHVRIIQALLLRYVKTAAGQERPAYFWLTIEPLLQVGLVVSLYWLFGRTIVYGMPAVPFAIVGVGTWLMFRTMLMRISTGPGREFVLCYFPVVSRFDIYLSKALFFGISYFLATLAMLIAAHYLEIGGSTVKEPAKFFVYWLLLWTFSFGFALTFNYVFVLVPALNKTLLILMRGLYLVSSVVVVTEQFATEDKAFFLWNPLVHGMQLLRSAYFYEYTTDDASLGYFLAATLAILLCGLIGERSQRRREISA